MAVVKSTLTVFLVAAMAASAAAATLQCASAESNTTAVPSNYGSATIDSSVGLCAYGYQATFVNSTVVSTVYYWGVANFTSPNFNITCNDTLLLGQNITEQSTSGTIGVICGCCTNFCNLNTPCSETPTTATTNTTNTTNTTIKSFASLSSPMALLVLSTASISALASRIAAFE